MRVIHIQTTVQCVLGVMDEEGNVIQKHPLNLELNKLDRALFVSAAESLQKTQRQLEEQQVASAQEVSVKT